MLSNKKGQKEIKEKWCTMLERARDASPLGRKNSYASVPLSERVDLAASLREGMIKGMVKIERIKPTIL
jgi:hypothetical protein